MSNDKVAIIGAGGIGGYIAAQLAWAGRDPLLCVRTRIDHLTITEEDGRERRADPRVADDPGGAGPVDWILLTTKAQDTAGAAGWVRALAGPDTRLVVVQNGIGHADRAAPIAAGTAVVPAIIYCSVERTAPTRIVHHGAARLILPAGSAAEALRSLFDGTAFTVEAEADFRTVAWRKLLGNVAANPLTALTLRRTAIFAEPALRDLARGLLSEAVAVARADGAALTEADAERVLGGMGGHGGRSGTSMLYDRLAGRPLEHAFITGAVVEAGRRHGVPTPLNAAVLALLAAASGRPLDGTG